MYIFKNKILSLILLYVTVSIILIGVLSVCLIIKDNIDKNLENYKNLLKSRAIELDSFYKVSFDRIAYIKERQDLRRILSTSNNYTSTDMLSDYHSVRDFFQLINAMSNKETKINVYSLNGSIATEYTKNIRELDVAVYNNLKFLQENEYVWVWTGTTLNLYCGIFSNRNVIGILELVIYHSVLLNGFDFINGNDKSQIIYHMPENGIAFDITSHQPVLNGDFFNVKDAVVVQLTSCTHQLIMITDKMLSYKSIFVISGIYLLLLILLVVVISYFARLSVNKVTLGLYDLIDNIDAEGFMSGNTRLNFNHEDNEFQIISTKFSELMEKMKSLHDEIRIKDDIQVKMEMELLQANINPHFLYNSLSAIRWLSNEPKINKLIKSMVTFYRIGLNSGEIYTCIEKELTMIREYINVLQISYQSDFVYNQKVDSRIFSKLILKNSLQPIVENAFIHGINGKESNGVITLEGTLDRHTICFTIQDNGCGMAKETVDKILNCSEITKTSGYGLHNVIARFKAHYKDAFRISIDSLLGGGYKGVLVYYGRREWK